MTTRRVIGGCSACVCHSLTISGQTPLWASRCPSGCQPCVCMSVCALGHTGRSLGESSGAVLVSPGRAGAGRLVRVGRRLLHCLCRGSLGRLTSIWPPRVIAGGWGWGEASHRIVTSRHSLEEEKQPDITGQVAGVIQRDGHESGRLSSVQHPTSGLGSICRGDRQKKT